LSRQLLHPRSPGSNDGELYRNKKGIESNKHGYADKPKDNQSIHIPYSEEFSRRFSRPATDQGSAV
jgi:hypothetical protein